MERILIANRGEIAYRILGTLSRMGRTVIAVYSDPDAEALHVCFADEAHRLPGSTPADTYLNIPLLIETARRARADAIHPGYGFLSENAAFAKACEEAGITFIGPGHETIAQMGSKIRAKELAMEAGVPVVPGYNGAAQDDATLKAEALRIGFPLLVKASAGGGGKGMRVVHGPEQLAQSLEMARSEAQKAFGDGTLLLERYFTSVKHIEVQIFGDSHGRQVHLFERECSIQRRHQKIIEESPSPSLSPEQRERICNSALALARHINYVNAGTVEFILDEKGDFYFLEVNTRLQVEHPVTEMVTGLNLVEMQVRVAEGAQLADLLPQEVQQQGHAIECRIYAEDPSKNYLPSSGKILAYEEADVASTTDPVEFRYDSGIYHHLEVTPFYDPMLAKVTAHARTRDKALHDMDRILAETLLLGVRTNMAQLRDIVKHPHFVDASFDTHFLDTYGQSLPSMHGLPTEAVALATGMYLGINTRRAFGSLTGWAPIGMAPIALVAKHCGRPVSVSFRYEGSDFMVQVDGHTHRFEPDAYDSGKVDGDVSAEYQTKVGNTVLLLAQGYNHDVEFEPLLTYATATAQRGGCTAPMPGEVVRIMIKEGDTVKAGQPMLILSAMKMENTIEAPADGRVEAVLVKEKDQVKADQTLVTLSDSESK